MDEAPLNNSFQTTRVSSFCGKSFDMADYLTPQWIRKKKEAIEREAVGRKAESNAQALAEMIVRTDGPNFWRELVKELSIAVASLEQINMNGAASPCLSSDFEEHCRVQVGLDSIRPQFTYTDLFYIKGHTSIRCHTMQGDAFPLAFRVIDSKLGVFANNSPLLLNPEMAAEFVIERMIKRLERRQDD